MEYVEKHREYFVPFVENDQTFEDYLEVMKREGSWGGNVEIQAFSASFSMDVVIHIYNQQPYYFTVDDPKRVIHLSYHNGDHYNSIRWIDDINDDIPREIPRIIEEKPKLKEKETRKCNHSKKIKEKELKIKNVLNHVLLSLEIDNKVAVEKALKKVFKNKRIDIDVCFS